MIRSQRAILKSTFPCPEFWNKASLVRCQSTKSAIHAALKKSKYPDQRPYMRFLRPPERPTSTQEDAKAIHRPTSGVLGYKDEVSRNILTRDIRRLHQGAHDGHEDEPFHYSERVDGSVGQPFGKKAGSGLSTFLPVQEIIDSADNSAAERRPLNKRREGQVQSEQPRERDSVKNQRFDDARRMYQQDHKDWDPLTLPYTTPASEFLYGHGVVAAALEANRRQLYRLYIYHSSDSRIDERSQKMRYMALGRNLPVERVPREKLRMLDRMSGGRPHNGFVLEASPLPRMPVIGFDRVLKPGEEFLVFPDRQSLEDSKVNGTDPRIKYRSTYPRFPFVLLLDGVLDPQNLGAILRSAFFLGVDAVALSTNGTAPLSSSALKASAGASEALPIVTVSRTRPFLDECKSNGWKVYASTPAPTSFVRKSGHTRRHLNGSTLVSDVTKRPCILVLGSEGQGLYKDVQRAANNTISIEGPRRGKMGVDSLNVSVAAGMLCEAMLRNPGLVDEKPQYFNEAANKDLHIRDRLF